MRSRALTAGLPSAACVERYACQVLAPAPAEAASVAQCLSAPSRPPRSAPLPGPAEVTKKVMLADWACAGSTARPANKAAAEIRPKCEIVLTTVGIRDPPMIFDSTLLLHWPTAWANQHQQIFA